MPYRKTSQVTQRLARRRASIVKAAAQRFSEHGYPGTTMAAVARDANSSVGCLYSHFANKEALFLGVVQDFVDELDQALDEAATKLTPGLCSLAGGLYVAILLVLARPELCLPVLGGETAPSLRRALTERFATRAQEFFAATPESLGDLEHQVTSHVWLGAMFALMEQQLTTAHPMPPLEIARFVARWNLQALGHHRDRVQTALEQAERQLNLAPTDTSHAGSLASSI